MNTQMVASLDALAKALVAEFPVVATVSFDAGTGLISLCLRVEKCRRHMFRSFPPSERPVVDEELICDLIARFIAQAGPWPDPDQPTHVQPKTGDAEDAR
jgi:hypothetical protein